MPGYANWRTLYFDEYRQLREEGYPVGASLKPDMTAEYLPFPADVRGQLEESSISEAEWEQAYWNLWRVREQGVVAGWPYVEPDGFDDIIAEADDPPRLEPLPPDVYAARIKGAWFGRCAGCILGKPLEMGWDRHKIREYLESVDAYPLVDWVPARSEKLGITLRTDCIPSTRGNVRFAQSDDDLHYTVMSLLLAEEHGLDFTTRDIGMNLLHNVPICWLWGADHQLYYHFVRLANDRGLEEQLASLPLQINPWREWIDGQLKADFWGYITPGGPRVGARYIHRQASASLVKNGVYGGMFVAGCLSAALSPNPTVDAILRGGLSVIPRRSRLAEAVRCVIGWAAEDCAWEVTCDRIHARYGHLQFADQINNLAMCVLALIYGELDYTRSITIAVMAGIDVDCNGATVGSLVGAAVGYDGLDPHWITPLHDTLKTVVAGFGEGRISELVERTLAFRRRMSEALQ